MKKIVHISDLHFDRISTDALAALARSARRMSPHLVVCSGDFTQRAFGHQFRAARSFIEGFSCPVLGTPGNHDIPAYDIISRIFRPYGPYRRFILPVIREEYADEDVAVRALNTSRAYTMKSGRISRKQILDAQKFFEQAEGKFKILVTHHPFDVPQLAPDANIVGGRVREAMDAFSACKVDMFLAGHLHSAQVSVTWKRYRQSPWNAILSNAGTPISTRLRGSPFSFTEMNVGENLATVNVYTYATGNALFEHSERHTFVKTREGWRMAE